MPTGRHTTVIVLAGTLLCASLTGCDGPPVPPAEAFAPPAVVGEECLASIDCSEHETGTPCGASDDRCFGSDCVSAEEFKASMNAAGLVEIKGGSFEMGCVPGDTLCNANEKPRGQVDITGFYVMATEVSVGAYADCIDDGTCSDEVKTRNCTGGAYNEPSTYNNITRIQQDQKFANHPINCVTYEEAAWFCWRAFSGGKLPTEAQFEFMLRQGSAGPNAIYPHGSSMPPKDSFANLPNSKDDETRGAYHGTEGYQLVQDYYDDAVATWPVDNKGTPIGGVYDLWGNLWEWTRDRVVPGSLLPTHRDGTVDPVQAVDLGNPVIRGGGFYYTGKVKDGHYEALRTSFRLDSMKATHFKDDLGFRCVVELPKRQDYCDRP